MGKITNRIYDLIVVGAGAAGMVAAITAARENKNVILLEKTEKPGKKLLATGNGKCNFTNQKMNPSCYYGDPELIETALHAFDTKDALEFFHSIGISARERNGYVYPRSEQATSVVSALLYELERLSVTIKTGVEVREIEAEEHRAVVTIDQGRIIGKKILIATGLRAAPKLGSDGSMIPVIKRLGHRFEPILPALCGFYCQGLDFRSIAGVRAQGRVRAWVQGKCVAEDEGEIQFTDYGISGIPVFQISRFLSQGLYQKQNVEIECNLLPDFDKVLLQKELEYRRDVLRLPMGPQLLRGLVHQKLSDLLFRQYPKMDSVSELSERLSSLRMKVTAWRDYEFAQVCTGGIPASQLNPKTLASALVPNLYFAGEILNVDGICGGYNLHFAWATGQLAANCAIQSI